MRRILCFCSVLAALLYAPLPLPAAAFGTDAAVARLAAVSADAQAGRIFGNRTRVNVNINNGFRGNAAVRVNVNNRVRGVNVFAHRDVAVVRQRTVVVSNSYGHANYGYANVAAVNYGYAATAVYSAPQLLVQAAPVIIEQPPVIVQAAPLLVQAPPVYLATASYGCASTFGYSLGGYGLGGYGGASHYGYGSHSNGVRVDTGFSNRGNVNVGVGLGGVRVRVH